MRAGGIDAFAAPVGKPRRVGAPDKPGKPAWEIAAHHIPVARRRHPAGDEAEENLIPPRRRAALQRLLEIEQAEIILPSSADNRLLRLLPRIKIEPVQLIVDLALEIFRVSRDPDGGAVLLRPEARGRDITERLARARARLGEDEI